MRHTLFILGLLSFISTAHAVRVSYSSMGIKDDEIAAAIRDPKPLAVTRVINLTKEKYKEEKYPEGIESMDFTANMIALKGATQLLQFANDELPNLRTIYFYDNRIYDMRGHPEYKDFEEALVTLLNKPTFEKIDLRLNGIANISWYQDILSKAREAKTKIKWYNDDND